MTTEGALFLIVMLRLDRSNAVNKRAYPSRSIQVKHKAVFYLDALVKPEHDEERMMIKADAEFALANE